jgi:hypothetical protein
MQHKILAYVYYENKLGRRSAANLLTREEALRIAANIAELPEFLATKRSVIEQEAAND